jgi:hypothetical protein
MTDTWERRRQGLSPLTLNEKAELFRERQSKKGFKQRTLMIHEDVLKAVDKYTKQRKTTKRVIWDEVLRAGVAALDLQK